MRSPEGGGSERGRERLADILERACAVSETDTVGREFGRLLAADVAHQFHTHEMQTREGRARCADWLRRMADDFQNLSAEQRIKLLGIAEDVRQGRIDL